MASIAAVIAGLPVSRLAAVQSAPSLVEVLILGLAFAAVYAIVVVIVPGGRPALRELIAVVPNPRRNRT